MTVIVVWTADLIRALRGARRMSQRAFAEHLGVTSRIIAKWESSKPNTPNTRSSSALDMSLRKLTEAERAMFDEHLRLAGEPKQPLA